MSHREAAELHSLDSKYITSDKCHYFLVTNVTVFKEKKLVILNVTSF